MTVQRETAAQPVRDERELTHDRQVELLETTGRLAGGIAHDFNNLLASIRGYAELLELQLQKRGGESELRDLAEIQTAAKRANEQTDRLLAFAGRLPTRPRTIDPKESVGAVERLLKKLAPSNVQFSVSHAATGGTIEVDVSQFERIMMYLAVAAFDAMPDGGECDLSTQWRESGARPLSDGIVICASNSANTRVLEIRVTDTRPAASEAQIRRAFMPYANSRDGDDPGRGLGLPAVYGMARKMNATIVVSPGEAANGSPTRTSFHVLIPAPPAAPPSR